VEDAPEAYEFNWVGKQAARAEVLKPIKKTLRPVKEDSVDWDNTQNLYIEGDNLEVLKLLQKSYLGKVKMIYIDPPYNTGNDFVYHDDFAMSADEYAEASGAVDELGNKYIKNMDSNGRFHSDWCSMMYSRLMVARTLLAEDGVIFISIDEHEEENLKKISNEIFGCSNFVGTIIWERAFAPKNDAKYLSDSHDYVLVFAKTIDKFQIGLLPRSEEANARYKNPDNDPRGPWTADNMTVKTYSANYDYEIVTPNGSVMSPPNGRCWFTSKERMDKLIQENRVWFGETGGNMPRLKRFLCDVQQGMTATTIWKYTEVGHNQEGRQELKKLFDNKGYFDGPKPLRLIIITCMPASLAKASILLSCLELYIKYCMRFPYSWAKCSCMLSKLFNTPSRMAMLGATTTNLVQP
jgi:adenine-specific DNA-methyltransferase